MFILSQFRYTKYVAILRNRSCFMRHSSNKHFQQSKLGLSKCDTLMKMDGIPAEYRLVYRAPMESYIAIAKNISTITTIVISAAAAYTATNQYKLVAPSYESLGLVTQTSDIWYFSVGFVMITLIIRLFVAKYPLRIYRANEKYIAVYDSQIPFRPSKHTFCKGDVAEVNSKFNPWGDSTYYLGKRKSLLLSRYFRTPADYNEMLGYN
ncbi:uncharacterized protein LOC129244863 [Anastrepha obliqua]|uniref:uncharacterized protein LOC129244863 n=1 Tax=Anastrepha obliqua TaxID=95512 RepID=UPI002409F5B7|nr:uncharacterized protein LOC129244863 [Anastrepha obliqua]